MYLENRNRPYSHASHFPHYCKMHRSFASWALHLSDFINTILEARSAITRQAFRACFELTPQYSW